MIKKFTLSFCYFTGKTHIDCFLYRTNLRFATNHLNPHFKNDFSLSTMSDNFCFLQECDNEDCMSNPTNFATLRQKHIDGTYTTLEGFQVSACLAEVRGFAKYNHVNSNICFEIILIERCVHDIF